MEEFVKLNIDKIPYNCDYNKNNKKTIILLSGFAPILSNTKKSSLILFILVDKSSALE